MKTRKEAIYLQKSVEYGYETIHTSVMEGYVQIGVAKDVEFVLASDEEQLKSVIAELEAAKKREMAESQQRLNRLDEKIQSLLAITHEPA